MVKKVDRKPLTFIRNPRSLMELSIYRGIAKICEKYQPRLVKAPLIIESLGISFIPKVVDLTVEALIDSPSVFASFTTTLHLRLIGSAPEIDNDGETMKRTKVFYGLSGTRRMRARFEAKFEGGQAEVFGVFTCALPSGDQLFETMKQFLRFIKFDGRMIGVRVNCQVVTKVNGTSEGLVNNTDRMVFKSFRELAGIHDDPLLFFFKQIVVEIKERVCGAEIFPSVEPRYRNLVYTQAMNEVDMTQSHTCPCSVLQCGGGFNLAATPFLCPYYFMDIE